MSPPAYRTCLVTGASSGIGAALAREIAKGGVEVVLCARRRPELEAVAQRIRDEGGRARVEVIDLASADETVEALRRIDTALGGLDLLIANAGLGLEEGLDPHSWEAVRGACQVNFAGTVATLTALLPRMVARGRGHLVGVSSLASFGSLRGAAAYCAPKAGLSMFLDCLRLDLADSAVSVTTIHPGFVRTPMVAKARHPMPQLVEPERAAQLIWSRLPRRPARIDFPQPLAFAARLFAALPRVLHDWLLRWTPGVKG